MHLICVVTASYTLDFPMTKSPELVFWMKHKISENNFLVVSLMEKMFIIQFHSMEKMSIIIFYSLEKMLIMLFS